MGGVEGALLPSFRPSLMVMTCTKPLQLHWGQNPTPTRWPIALISISEPQNRTHIWQWDSDRGWGGGLHGDLREGKGHQGPTDHYEVQNVP